MDFLREPAVIERYRDAPKAKAHGATYTPKALSDFVAEQILNAANLSGVDSPLLVLDPAVGDAELLVSLLEKLDGRGLTIEVHGFETDSKALDLARGRLERLFPSVQLRLEPTSFLEFVLDQFGDDGNGTLFRSQMPKAYDLVIANPPYVRTQIMGSNQARLLAQRFGLTGRVDLYHAFLIGMSQVIKPSGIAGIIVSNRFMTIKSGASVRSAIRERFNIHHVWDLGDTKIFDVAVLPAVLVLEGRRDPAAEVPRFTSIYETSAASGERVGHAVEALSREGVVELGDGRRFLVRHGRLDCSGARDAIWRLGTDASDAWLATVVAHSWGKFRDIGKVRVGVKTCADTVFIRSDWQQVPEAERPELLRPLTTHHVARQYRALQPGTRQEILYPHEVVQEQRQAVDLAAYPRTHAYLEKYRAPLEARKYVLEAGRRWYEIWVPQDPSAWGKPKLVFRDIAEEPTFWIDLDGTVVNGDCYWLISESSNETDLLWLAAAVGNSGFIKAYYDHRFHNKLYSGRRRFMSQYVEEFPLPDPKSKVGELIIRRTKDVFADIGVLGAETLTEDIDRLVWKAFGLAREEAGR